MSDQPTGGSTVRASLFTRNFVLATIANLCFFTSVTTFFVLPVQLEDLGASRAEVGRIMGAFGVTSLFGIPLTGMLVDRFGRRPFMLLGGVLWAVTALSFASVDGLGFGVYALRLAQGLAFSFAFVATNALVADLAPPGALGRAISVFGTTTLATHAVGPTVGEVVAERWGFPTLYVGSAVVTVAAVIAYASIRESRRPQTIPPPGSPVTMRALAVRRGASSALVGGITTAIAFGSAMQFMPIFVRTRDIDSYSPFFAAYVIAAVGARLIAGGLGDRFGHRRVAVASIVAFASSVAAVATATSTAGLVAVGLVFGLTHGWAYPALNALFVEGASSAARGRAMALYNLSFNLGITLAAFFSGEVAQRYGYSAMWLTAAALCGLGVASLLMDRPARARRASGP